MTKLNYSEIEKKWQKYWQENQINKTNNDFSKDKNLEKKKFYILDMFPYPSGEGLHVGHPKGYIATDVYARMKKMQGYNVLHPMGWDAFGLPAEQYAIKNKINPNIATAQNVKRYKEQIEMLGLNYDWDREVNTTDPKFYKWTEWMFKQMYKDGLAYESFEPINWCPSCKTGLANEDLDGNNCERCGSIVEKKPLRQWVIKITNYADRLLADLDKLDWEPHIKELQRNWIGKSEGSEIDFKLVPLTPRGGMDTENFTPPLGAGGTLKIFTTRADTLFGCTFMCISYSLAKEWIQNGWNASEEIKKFINKLEQEEKERTVDFDMSKLEKEGIDTNIKAINPANGEEVPIYIANYILSDYGTGVIMAVPAHDARDYEFAKKYNLEIREVIKNKYSNYLVIEKSLDEENIEKLKDFGDLKVEHISDSWGRFFRVNISSEKEESFVKFLSENLRTDNGTWYTDSMGTSNYVIFPNKVFKINSNVDLDNYISYGLSIGVPKEQLDIKLNTNLFQDEGILINSQEFDGMNSEEARVKITEKVGGKIVSKYKLKDWVFARQRYWGEPFPIVFDENRKSYTVADKDLPVILPNVENYEPTDTGESPLANIKDWVEVYGFINDEGEFESSDSINNENPTEFFGDGEDVLRPDLEIINRKGIDVIIKDKDENFYFVKDKNLGINFVGGGIDNDSEIEAVKRELIEETGFIDFEIVGKLKRKIIWNGYHINKKRNQKSESSTYIVELKSDARVKSEIETGREDGIHELVKLNKEDCINNINYKNHKLLFQDYLNGDFIEIKKFFRETNTMPQWAGSSWYYLRYIDPKNDEAFVNKELEKKWNPVDFYVGGAEHATRHLIYARFWHKYLFDKGLVNYDEPFNKLQTVGLIMAPDGKKMSKRYGNVVNPDDVIKEYGCDAMRTYEMFMGPFEKSIAWNTNSMAGVSRFLERVYNLVEKINLKEEGVDSKEIERVINETIKKVGDDIEKFGFNTAIAQLMICLNTFEDELKKGNNISKNTFSKFIQILSPFAVHICEEIWQDILGENSSIHTTEWPKYNEAKVKKDEAEMVMQVNGKLRGSFKIKIDATDDEVKDFVKSLDIYKKYVSNELEVKKIVIVKNKLINIVI